MSHGRLYRLRRSTEDDHDAIVKVWHRSASLPDVGPVLMPTKVELRRRLDIEVASGWHVTVAVGDEGVLGFVAIKPQSAILAELFVDPRELGRRIGQALLAHAKSAMPDGFTLYTRSANAGARRFYEREGLVAMREGVHPRTGDSVTYYRWNAG